MSHRIHLSCLLFAFIGHVLSSLYGSEELGVEVPNGFAVSLYADDDLAHDIFSMTIDSLGRVVVSGQGYVRILEDHDRDGKADAFKQFVEGPGTGAQGMFFDGRDLICTGDAGVIRFRDQDADDRADGPAQLLLNIKTGREHHSHSVQQGPDGWWYVIAGNLAGVDRDYVTRRSSPVRQPSAGTLLRLTPDFSGCEVFADGFRNAYDFAFHRQGDLFVYDSDGEREVSLPWYRPTRVFHTLPGSHAGWFSRSWKRAGYFFDMPPVIGALGRGSPTGVVCYRHEQFPNEYINAVLVADWTYGRVVAFPLVAEGSTYSSEPIPLMSGVGHFGFAPTDLAIAPNGDLYVSVGGRGTRGGVFRVASNRVKQSSAPPSNDGTEARLARCLSARQPLDSWSRAQWMPLARQLGKRPFQQAALDENLLAAERIRAIEISTELFGGLDASTARGLATSRSVDVRARAAWSLGRMFDGELNADVILPFLNDPHPMVARFALESLLGWTTTPDQHLLFALARQLQNEDRFVRQTAARVVANLSDAKVKELDVLASTFERRGTLAYLVGRLLRGEDVTESSLLVGTQILRHSKLPSLKLEAVRMMQLALGDVGPSDRIAAVFDGYTRRGNRQGKDPDALLIVSGQRVAESFPTGERVVDLELSRLLAMLEPSDSELLDRLLDQITSSSQPSDDLHYLIVAARTPVQRTDEQRTRIAKALLGIEWKIIQRKLNRDRNWDPRNVELFRRLVELDPALPDALFSLKGFGLAGHVIFLLEVPGSRRANGLDAIVGKIHDDPEYPWNSDIVAALADSGRHEYLDLIRAQFDHFALRGAVLLALAKQARPQDRDKFIAGLESSQHEVLSACLKALSELPPSRESVEQIALVQLLRRLGREQREYSLRDDVVRLLRRNMNRQFGYRFGREGRGPQSLAVNQWTDLVVESFPDDAQQLLGSDQESLGALEATLSEVNWTAGNASRGKRLFESRLCAQCHGGRAALGPDLAGVARRFSREDLFTAIVLPGRDVSPRYQTTYIETTSGMAHSGIVIYESIDGLLLRNSTNQTIRIESNDIEYRCQQSSSIMPSGLLKDFSAGELADMYAYLQSL